MMQCRKEAHLVRPGWVGYAGYGGHFMSLTCIFPPQSIATHRKRLLKRSPPLSLRC